MPSATVSGHANRLLARLPDRERAALLAGSETVSLPHGEQVYRQGEPMSHVYFPISAVTSVILVMEDGRGIEAATIGNEGMVGVPVYLGLESAPHSTVAQVPGDGLRVEKSRFVEMARERAGGAIDALVRRYVAYTLRFANQTIACNALHTVEERACRWLLMTHDRAGRDVFHLTHEYLAEMLGVHRQTVSVVAGMLQRAGFLAYRRGTVRIRSREGLESAACECYEATRRMYEGVMGGP